MTRIHARKWGLPLSRAAVGLALAPALVVLLASLSPMIIRGVEKAPRSGGAECRTIADASSRLACYDARAKTQLPVPAKGGEPIVP
ncbi:MAG TPA: hypothetical protein VL101_02395 [Nordella sp.]|nr:hypothetical protein [Nordella sp.]